MENTHFGYSVAQASKITGDSKDAIRRQIQRTGGYRGIRAKQLPNGRYILPRADILRLTGRYQPGPKVYIDVRATSPWLESRSLSLSDPAIEAIAIDLNDPRPADSPDPVGDWAALRDWMKAALSRYHVHYAPKLSLQDRRDVQRTMAAAVAQVVAYLDEADIAEAVDIALSGGFPCQEAEQ